MRRIVSLPARIFSAIALAAALAASAHALPATAAEVDEGRQVALRVATYNIHAGIGADRRFDLDRQIAALREIDADILALQEVDVNWSGRSQWRDLVTELADALDMSVFFGHIYSLDPPSEGAPRREFGIAMLSRYPIIDAENHDITRLSTQTPGPTPQPAPGFPEVVVNVRGALVHAYGTHLDYRADPYVRELQVADMRRIMADDQGRQQLLLGDFNAEPGAPELAPLWEDVVDAWGAADGGLTYPATGPVKRIDYVTVSPQIEVRSSEVPATLASDHLPVVADLVVTRGA